jgi:urease accessory protein
VDVHAHAGWEAALNLGFAQENGATRLARRSHRGPLVVQRPFLPEGPGVCHVYVLHPPGGLVGGDELTIDVEVDAAAHALVTTPAASKVYRTTGAAARQVQRLRVADGATLEWLPQEAIIYDGARAELETRVELAPGARFIGIDAICFGLPAGRAPFERGSCRQAFELHRAGRPLLIERGHYDAGGDVMRARWGLGGASVLAFVIAAPAPAEPAADAVRALAASASVDDSELAAATIVGDGDALVARYFGRSAERARAFLHDAWRLLRPAVLGRAAVPPRVWAT